jgi:hypothetical protein
MRPFCITFLILSIGFGVTQAACAKQKRSQADFHALAAKTSLIKAKAKVQDVISLLGKPDSDRKILPTDPGGEVADRGLIYYGPDVEHMIIMTFKQDELLSGVIAEPTKRTQFAVTVIP